MTKHIQTGITGLDQLLEGGFLENRAILIEGGPGTGKTTFGLQFLVHGAKHEEPGILLSLEYEPVDLVEDMQNYGWNARELIDNNQLRILTPPGGFEKPEEMTIDAVINLIFEHVNEIGAKRLVIDSLNSLEIALEHEDFNRQDLLRFITLLRELDCTILLIAEQSLEEHNIMYSYLAHGVIKLYNLKRGASRLRGIEVLKMRGINHSNLTHSMAISNQSGINVLPHEVDLGS